MCIKKIFYFLNIFNVSFYRTQSLEKNDFHNNNATTTIIIKIIKKKLKDFAYKNRKSINKHPVSNNLVICKILTTNSISNGKEEILSIFVFDDNSEINLPVNITSVSA